MSGESEGRFPRRPLRALRTRLHLISGAVADTRLQVLDTREVVLARLDELLHHSERGDARLAELAGRIEDLTTARRPDRDAAPEWEYLPEGWARERPDARGRGWDVESVAHTYAQRWPAFVETLIDRVWGEQSPERVRRALHAHVTRIRRLLEQAGAADGSPAGLVRRSR